MGTARMSDIDPYMIDPLEYLAGLNGKLSLTEQREHYHVIRPALFRVQSEDPVAFDLALKEVSKKLKIKTKTVTKDLKLLAAPPVAKKASQLLDQMGQTRFLHLAQDFVDGKLWFGVRAGEDTLLLNSERELLTLDELPEGFRVKDNGFDLCRLSRNAIDFFLRGGTAPGAELLADLRRFFTRFAVFKDPRIALLLATWTLGTYCYRVFRVYPYLVLRSPEKRCGKSRVLDLLSLLAFNASPRVVHPTTAQLFRGPSRNGGTLLLDEVEALKNADKEHYAGLLAVLNNGFEQGGSVSRLEPIGTGEFREMSFETYCPRALAGINRLPEVLEDRSILIVMQRKLKREQTERFSPSRFEDEAQALRDRCYLWALTHTQNLATTYSGADRFFAPYLDSLDDRAQDLWEPLVSIVALADAEQEDKHKTSTEELTALARALSQVREGATEDSTTVHVLQALQTIVTEQRQSGLWPPEDEVAFTPTELAKLLKEKLGWETLSTKGLAALLNPLALFSKNTRLKEKVTLAYHLNEQSLAELSERYARTAPTEEEKK